MNTTFSLFARAVRRTVLLVGALPLAFFCARSAEGLVIHRVKNPGSARPVVLDPGVTGLNLTALDDVVPFDIDAKGVPTPITWTQRGADVGFFWIDLNNNGQVDGAGELFGDATQVLQGQNHDGFTALAYFDDPAHGGNGDRMLSAADSVWSQLRLWVDWDHDGRVGPGEVSTMQDLHIQSISLSPLPLNLSDPRGNYVLKYSVAQGEPGYDSFWLFDVLFQRAEK